MFKKVLSIALITAATCCGINGFGQQDAVFTNYTIAPNVFNPAFAGSRDALNLTLLNRAQWVGFEGAPRSFFFSGHSPIQDKNIGVGASFLSDKLGPETFNNVYVDFSYALPLSANSTLRFGLKGGGTFYSFDRDLQLENTISESSLVQIDNHFVPNVGFGAYWNSDKFFAGISVPKLLATEILAENNGITNRVSNVERHYYLMGGASFEVSPDITLKPSAMVRLAGSVPESFDITANAVVYERLWFGFNYRYTESLAGMLGFQINEQLRAGYSYDFPLGNLSTTNHSGSHEVMITYDFIFTKGKVASPRYF